MKNRLWNELSDKSKAEMKKLYHGLTKQLNDERLLASLSFTDTIKIKERREQIVDMFGLENLDPLSKVRTFDDFKEYIPSMSKFDDVVEPIQNAVKTLNLVSKDKNNERLVKKAIATLKIAKLIDTAYGGLPTMKEWQDMKEPIYYIRFNDSLSTAVACKAKYKNEHHFIAFRSLEQAEDFLINNLDLVNDYYMRY